MIDGGEVDYARDFANDSTIITGCSYIKVRGILDGDAVVVNGDGKGGCDIKIILHFMMFLTSF